MIILILYTRGRWNREYSKCSIFFGYKIVCTYFHLNYMYKIDDEIAKKYLKYYKYVCI